MLKNWITFYVPSTKNVGEKLSRSECRALVRRVANKFAESFGGATETQGKGYWKSETGKLITESVTLVKAYYTIDSDNAHDLVKTFAETIKSEYGQEAIAIETPNGIEFI